MTVVLTPGQGPHNPDMINHISGLDDLTAHLEKIAGEPVLQNIKDKGQDYLNRPEIISPICLLVTLAAWKNCQDAQPSAFAGYSIGQWAAMTLAGMISPEQAIEITYHRGLCMADALKDSNTGMTAIIGLSKEVIEEQVSALNADSLSLMITNQNAPGQITIGGDIKPLAAAEDAFKEKGAFKILRLPVKGAWHSFALEPAVTPFHDYLKNIGISAPSAPVINNVTGNFLPKDDASLKQTLADHLAKPVLWQQGIKTLIDNGEMNFLEVGYGDMLTKFGVFINRKASFRPSNDWGVQAPVRRTKRA